MQCSAGSRDRDNGRLVVFVSKSLIRGSDCWWVGEPEKGVPPPWPRFLLLLSLHTAA